MDLGTGGPPAFFVVFLIIFLMFFVTVVTLIVKSALRSRRVLRDAGLDPLAAEAQLAVRLARSGMLAPSPQAKTLEQRLTELADLHTRGVISDDELAAARATALGA